MRIHISSFRYNLKDIARIFRLLPTLWPAEIMQWPQAIKIITALSSNVIGAVCEEVDYQIQ